MVQLVLAVLARSLLLTGLACAVLVQSHSVAGAQQQAMISATCDTASQRCFFFDNSSAKYQSRLKRNDVDELSRRVCSDNASGCDMLFNCLRMTTTRIMVVGLNGRTGEFKAICAETFRDAQKGTAQLIGMCANAGYKFSDCTITAHQWGQGTALPIDDFFRTTYGAALDAQLALKRSTLYAGRIDGAFGPASKAALREFMVRYENPRHFGELDGAAKEAVARFLKEGGFPAAPAAPPPAPAVEPAKPLSLQLVGTGTGFFIHSTGVLVTNNHVIDTCSELRLQSGEILRLLAKDPENDLAALKAAVAPHTLELDSSVTPVGSDVYPAGFPVPEALKSEFNFTSGIVTAATGRGATSLFQINAEVQPGNSGGPILNKSGKVVGVVVARLEKSDATTPLQNVNFGIRSGTLAQFMEVRGIPFNIGKSDARLETPEIAANAQKATKLVLCYAMK